jgi:hypothetical protein
MSSGEVNVLLSCHFGIVPGNGSGIGQGGE